MVEELAEDADLNTQEEHTVSERERVYINQWHRSRGRGEASEAASTLCCIGFKSVWILNNVSIYAISIGTPPS